MGCRLGASGWVFGIREWSGGDVCKSGYWLCGFLPGCNAC